MVSQIKLAINLKNNLYETLEDVEQVRPERVAAAAAFFLLDTLKENDELVKSSTFGGKGKLDTILKNALQAIEKYYPESIEVARNQIKEYHSSLIKS